MTVMGIGNSVPVIMDINTLDGTINKFISLDQRGASENFVPSYQTFGAIYNDKEDFFDGKNYIYSSFLMDEKIQFMRILND